MVWAVALRVLEVLGWGPTGVCSSLKSAELLIMEEEGSEVFELAVSPLSSSGFPFILSTDGLTKLNNNHQKPTRSNHWSSAIYSSFPLRTCFYSFMFLGPSADEINGKSNFAVPLRNLHCECQELLRFTGASELWVPRSMAIQGSPSSVNAKIYCNSSVRMCLMLPHMDPMGPYNVTTHEAAGATPLMYCNIVKGQTGCERTNRE